MEGSDEAEGTWQALLKASSPRLAATGCRPRASECLSGGSSDCDSDSDRPPDEPTVGRLEWQPVEPGLQQGPPPGTRPWPFVVPLR